MMTPGKIMTPVLRVERPPNSSLNTIESDGFQMFVFWVLRRYKFSFGISQLEI